MSSKLLAFLGLNDSGDVVVESHRKRRTDYMKKIQRLVVPEDEAGEAEPAPENIVTAPSDENPEQPAAAAEPEPVSQSDAPEENEPFVPEPPRPRDLRRSGAKKPKEKGSFMGRFLHVGDSLRRPGESDKALILVKSGVLELVEDLEDALVKGQSVLIDFEREDRKNMEAADLYFSMEGHPDLPAVKWLAKVCRDEDAKEYIRSHYESAGDMETFDYIFVDDGYKKRPKNFRKRSKF